VVSGIKSLNETLHIFTLDQELTNLPLAMHIISINVSAFKSQSGG